MAKIKILNARLSFPSLFHKNSFEEGQEGKYEATLLVPKSQKGSFFVDGKDVGIDGVREVIETYKKDTKVGKVPDEKLFLKDGDEDFDLDKYPEYADHWVLKGSNGKRPTVLDKARNPVAEEDELFYAGCVVNGILEPWVQNNKFGKRVNANLLGVQFVKDDEPFGAGKVDVTDDFDDLDDL